MTAFARMRDVFLADREPISALFCTYGFDARFFEAEILSGLLPKSLRLDRESGSSQGYLNAADVALARFNVSVFYDHLLGEGPELIYGSWPVRVGGRAFHPKLTVLDYGDLIRVVIGSANVTRAAWSQLLELFVVEDLVPGESHPWQAGVARFVDHLAEQIPDDQAGQRLTLHGNLSQVPGGAGPSRVVSSWDGPLIDAALDGIDDVKRLDVVTPFFEVAEGEGVFDELERRLGPVPGTLHVSTTEVDGRPRVSGPSDKLRALTSSAGGWSIRGVRATWDGDQDGAPLRALHGKLIGLSHSGGVRIVVGSANVTRAALLRQAPAGNVEIVVIADSSSKALASVLPQSTALRAEDVDFVDVGDPTGEDADEASGAERFVVSATYSAAAGELRLTFSEDAPPLSVEYATRSLGHGIDDSTWTVSLELGAERFVTVDDGERPGLVAFVIVDPEALAPRGAAATVGLEVFFDILAGFRDYPAAADGESRAALQPGLEQGDGAGTQGAIPWRRYLAAVAGLGREIQRERQSAKGIRFCIENPTRLAGLLDRLESARDDRRFTVADLLYSFYELERELRRLAGLPDIAPEGRDQLDAAVRDLDARREPLLAQTGSRARRQLATLREMDA